MKQNQIIGTIALCTILTGCGGSAADQSSGTDWNKFSTDNNAIYNAVTQKFANHYATSEITYPDYLSSDWSYADFDDEDDGKVIVSVPVTINDEKKDLWAVISTDGTNVKGYYLLIGDDLLVDDGSCDEVMSKVGLPTNDSQ